MVPVVHLIPSHNKNGEFSLIFKLLKTTAIAITLLTTPSFAAEVTYATLDKSKPLPPAVNTVTQPTVVELQDKITVLQLWSETLKEQRDAILDQLAVAQVTIKQLQAIQSTKK